MPGTFPRTRCSLVLSTQLAIVLALGQNGWKPIQARLRESAPPLVTELIQEITEHENFRFGNGGVVPSTHRWRIPAFVGGRVLLIWVSLVPVPSLGLLLGREDGTAPDFLLPWKVMWPPIASFPIVGN